MAYLTEFIQASVIPLAILAIISLVALVCGLYMVLRSRVVVKEDFGLTAALNSVADKRGNK